jgi:hypothetical protein
VQLVLDEDFACCSESKQISPDPLSSCCTHDIIEPDNFCCEVESSRQAKNGMSECSVEESSSNCCINEGKYLKSQEEYTSPARVEMPHIEIIISAALFSIDLFARVQETIEEHAHSPPYTLSSVDILHRHSVLII